MPSIHVFFSVADCLARCADTDGCSSSSVEYIKSSNNQISSRRCTLGKRRNGYMLFPQKNYISANMYCQCKSYDIININWYSKPRTRKGVRSSLIQLFDLKKAILFYWVYPSNTLYTFIQKVLVCRPDWIFAQLEEQTSSICERTMSIKSYFNYYAKITHSIET